MPDETVITFGDEIKSLGDNRFGGYLVRFTTDADPDLTGDFFTKDTDFDMDFPGVSTAYWNHGYGVRVGDQEIGAKKKLGRASLKMDEFGVWAEIILQERDEYEKRLAELAKAGKLGWSSGTVGHLVEYEQVGNAMHIKSWPLGKDASLTHRPAEPRNTVMPLKMFLGDNTTVTHIPEGAPEAVTTAVSEAVVVAEPKVSIPKEQNKMDITPEMLQQVASDAATKAVADYRASEPPVKTAEATVTVIKDASDQPWKSVGEFYQAVKNVAFRPHAADVRLFAVKANGLNETVPSEGGYLVPPQYAPGILEKMYSTGSLLARMSIDTVVGNRMIYNVVDETSRANGSRFGGITSYWLEEAGTKTASKPAFRQLDLVLNKVIGYVPVTDELLSDAVALESFLNRVVPQELKFRVEDAIINGTGVGMPLGILKSAALKSAVRTDGSEIDALDIGRMWAGRFSGVNDYIWLVSSQTFPQLLNMVIGQIPVYLPAGGLGNLPYGTILGQPVLETDYNPTLGTLGDIVLFSPSQYAMIQKGGIESASSIHVYFSTDETVYRFVYRVGGAPIWNSTLTGFDAQTYSPYVALAAST